MEQNKFPVKVFSTIAIVASLIVTACNNNDTNTGETVVTTDTLKNIPESPAPAMADSGAMMPSPTDTAAMSDAGMAKPNAAKKGMKGKAQIVVTTPPKMKADAAPDASGTYANVDYIPSFPGGNVGLQKYFDDNIQYPSRAQDEGVEGTVRISFTVDESGKIMMPAVEGGNQGYGLDAEALRVINKMPMWNPGKINGKPVKTKFVLPVQFSLADGSR